MRRFFVCFFNYLFYVFRSVPDNKTCSNESCTADKTINEQGMSNTSDSGKLLGRQAKYQSRFKATQSIGSMGFHRWAYPEKANIFCILVLPAF